MPDRSRQPSLPGFDPEPEEMRHAAHDQAACLPPALGHTSPPPESLAGQSVWVIDAHSLIHQVFHAMPEMTGPRGEPIGAVFGFTRDLLALLERKPDFLFCAFDLPEKTFRHEIYTGYKELRPAMHEDLQPQIPLIYRVVEALGIPRLVCSRYEADDVLATVARITDELGGHCFLVTSDKDCRQLITERVKLFNIRKNELFDREALRADWGITPRQVVDFQALVGDAVDQVPGVPLIGPKLARQLLEQYGTLENVLDHAHEVSGAKRRENLIACRQQAMLSRELVKLEDHVPIGIDWEAARYGRIRREAALKLFQEFGFRGLADRLKRMVKPVAGDGDALSLPPIAPEVAVEDESERPPLLPGGNVPFTVQLVDSPDAFDAFLSELRQQKAVSLDTETTHIWPRWAELVGLSFSWNEREGWYLPIRAPQGQPRLDLSMVLNGLRPVLEDPSVEKIGQNLKYDLIVLRAAGVDVKGVTFDTMIADYLLEAGERNHNLDELAHRYLNHSTIKIAELIGSGRNQKRMDEVDVRRVADYAGEDSVLPVRLRPLLAQQLERAGLTGLFDRVEIPLIDVLVEMEYNGIKIDVAQLARLSRVYDERLVTLSDEIAALAGHPLNIDSPKQLQQVLFNELGLPKGRRTQTGASTDAAVLEELAWLHPLPAKILEYRQYTKLKGTYIDALPRLVHPQTGRVHTSFNQVVTATGRLSSNDPNLQNIPIRTEQGREIRSAFIVGQPGWKLLSADYSQIELRILAHFSGDETLCRAFGNDEDIHARVAGQIHGVPLDQVTPAMRRQAKAVNFGVIYGQSPFGLARGLGIDKDAAARFIDNYFAGYPGIERFLNQVLAECRRTGYAKTILGRRRAIRGVRENAGRQRNLAERTAVNTVIQGSAADIIKLAMIDLHRRLGREGSPERMLLQIHDELVFELPSDQLESLAVTVTEAMAGVQPLSVPLKVDAKAGPNWADAEPLV